MATEKWCSLPRDIIELIFARLATFADRVRFGAVCAWWRYAVSNTPAAASLHPNSPLYLYFVRTTKLFCLVENRTYDLPSLQYPDHRDHHRHVGFSNGWFGTVDLDKNFYLFDPFSSACIDLPRVLTLPDVKPVRWLEGFYYMKARVPRETLIVSEVDLRNKLVRKFSLSPAMTAMVVYHEYRHLAFASPGDKRWTLVKVPGDLSLGGVTYHGADGKFYAVGSGGATICVDEIHGSVDTIVADNAFVPGPPPSGEPYLVSLPTGDLLCVYLIQPRNAIRPWEVEGLDFKIFKLATDAEKTSIWVDVQSLDDWAIFLDSNGAWARPSSEATKGNHVYFALSRSYVLDGKKRNVTESGIFDMAQKSISMIYDSKHARRKAFWIEA